MLRNRVLVKGTTEREGTLSQLRYPFFAYLDGDDILVGIGYTRIKKERFTFVLVPPFPGEEWFRSYKYNLIYLIVFFMTVRLIATLIWWSDWFSDWQSLNFYILAFAASLLFFEKRI